jgi:hypothetical protein
MELFSWIVVELRSDMLFSEDKAGSVLRRLIFDFLNIVAFE